MNDRRVFSRAIFPLVIIAALIWLAVETIGGDSSANDLPFSEALTLVRQNASRIDHVTFHPSSQRVDFHLAGGRTRTTVYPVDQSAYELEQLLDDKSVAFDASSTGSSGWWSILTSLLPFVLLFGFWIFLMQQMQRRKQVPDP